MTRKRTSKNKTKRKIRCAPSNIQSEKLPYSCYTKTKLKKLKELWNDLKNPILSNDPNQIYLHLYHSLKPYCSTNELCWITNKYAKQKFKHDLNNNIDIMNYTFAPNAPKTWKQNPNEWLSDEDIKNVMKQYQYAFPYFQFIGPVPIDFEYRYSKLSNNCVSQELCTFQLQNYINQNKTQIGIVFNTAPHTSNGEHWVCMFIDINKNTIYYFDSVGDSPPYEIQQFVKKLKLQNSKFTFKYNTRSHQHGNTECGVYTLYFLTNRIIHPNFENEINKHTLSDDFIQQFRFIYFN